MRQKWWISHDMGSRRACLPKLLWQSENNIFLPKCANKSCRLDPIVAVAKGAQCIYKSSQANAMSWDRRIENLGRLFWALAMRQRMQHYAMDVSVTI